MNMRPTFQNTPPIGGDGYTNDLTVTIATPERPGVNAAPSPVWFEVASVTGCDTPERGVGEVRDPRYHDLLYVWDFGDATNATPWNAALLNMPAVWKDINKAYGRRVCHVYSDPSPPGGYTVTVTVYERSTRRKGTATVSVNVGDPKLVFPGNRTIIFNPNGDNLAAYGYPSANVQTVWSNVLSARDGLGTTTAQILFAPTATLVGTQLCQDRPWGNIRFGGIDPATRPVISGYVNENGYLIRDNNSSTCIERVVFGLRFVGDWDSTTETGRIVDCFRTLTPTTATYLAMQHRCEFTGWESVGTFSGSTAGFNSYAVHSELIVTNWQNYGLTTAGDNAAVIACTSAQHIDALTGGEKDTPYYNNHGSLRDFNAKSLVISVCDMFSRNGWSAGGTGADGLDITADQACIRINTNGETGCSSYTERVTSEGMIWIEEQDTTKIDAPGNHVFDKVLVALGPRTIQDPIEVRHGGCTFRNMIGVILNAPSAQSNRPQKLFLFSNNFGMVSGDANFAIEEAREAENDVQTDAYNCTLIDLRTNANANNGTLVFRSNDTETFTIQNVENNVMHQPNRSPPLVPDAVNLSVALDYDLRHRGPRVNFLREIGTLASDVAPGGFFTLSYANVRTTRYNQSLLDTGAATDQAYMQAACPPHPTARHKMVMGATRLFAWVANNFEVTFEATEIRVYNRTLSTTWTAGTAWSLQLDRRNALPAWDALGSGFDMRAVTVPEPRPGPPAIVASPTGKLAVDDFYGTIRPETFDARGALLPA